MPIKNINPGVNLLFVCGGLSDQIPIEFIVSLSTKSNLKDPQ